MSPSCRSVLLLSLLLVLLPHSRTAIRTGLEARNLDDLQMDSEHNLVSLEDNERSQAVWPSQSQLNWRNYKETPLNSWLRNTEELLSDRHKRNLAVRDLADYRPYWFARDLRGSRGAKVYRPVRATFSAWGGK